MTKADLRGLGDARRIRTAVGDSSAPACFSSVAPWLTGRKLARITEAECTSRIFTPCQKLPGGCKSTVMVISKNNRDDVVVLKCGENQRIRIGMCFVRTQENDRTGTGRIGNKGLKLRGDLGDGSAT